MIVASSLCSTSSSCFCVVSLILQHAISEQCCVVCILLYVGGRKKSKIKKFKEINKIPKQQSVFLVWFL